MLLIISPAKTLDFRKLETGIHWTQPAFTERTATLVDKLKKYTPGRLAKLMNINAQLAQLNVDRYHDWHLPFTPENAKQALLSFKGDVYNGIGAQDMSENELDFAQEHLRILSGLYGVLKPLDLMQPYRLEMGTSLKGRGWKSLYEYWKKPVTEFLMKELHTKGNVLVNLASQEYFKAVDTKTLNCRIITPDFREYKNGEYKFIHVIGKRARGLMVRYIIKNKISNPENMRLFDLEGYAYNDRLTEGDKWVFTRE